VRMLRTLIYAWWQVIKCNYERIAFSILLGFPIAIPIYFLLLIVLWGMNPLDAAPRAMLASLVTATYVSIGTHLFNAVAGYVLWMYTGFEPDDVIRGAPVINPVKAV